MTQSRQLCSATKRNGDPCTLLAQSESGKCWAHDEANAAKRLENAKNAGSRPRPKRQRKNKSEIDAIKKRLKELADAVLQGRVSRGNASVCATLRRVLAGCRGRAKTKRAARANRAFRSSRGPAVGQKQPANRGRDMANLRGRVNRLEQAARGATWVFRMPDGTRRIHDQTETLQTFASMVARYRAYIKGEEPPEPTPLELSYVFGIPETPGSPDLSRVCPPVEAYDPESDLVWLEGYVEDDGPEGDSD